MSSAIEATAIKLIATVQNLEPYDKFASGLLDLSNAIKEHHNNPKLKARIRVVARSNFNDDGEIQIDDDAVVSMSDAERGAYVAAWVWVEDRQINEFPIKTNTSARGTQWIEEDLLPR